MYGTTKSIVKEVLGNRGLNCEKIEIRSGVIYDRDTGTYYGLDGELLFNTIKDPETGKTYMYNGIDNEMNMQVIRVMHEEGLERLPVKKEIEIQGYEFISEHTTTGTESDEWFSRMLNNLISKGETNPYNTTKVVFASEEQYEDSYFVAYYSVERLDTLVSHNPGSKFVIYKKGNEYLILVDRLRSN